MPLYQLRCADRSLKLGAVLFLLVLGYAYVFAFLMVKSWAGVTPAAVRATYVPAPPPGGMMEMSRSSTQPLDLSQVPEMKHTVDTALLIQDSHIHIMIYALVAGFETLIILGLGWSPGFRDTVIVAAFGFGALDFAGQWLMKAGLGGFAWLTLASGWGMALVYVIILGGTLRAVSAKAPRESTTP